MTTLREDVIGLVDGCFSGECGPWSSAEAIGRVAALLEATGAPAYMRVAADLRGEFSEGGGE